MEDSSKSDDVFHVYRLGWIFMVIQTLILVRVVHVPSANHLEKIKSKSINKCKIPVFKHIFLLNSLKDEISYNGFKICVQFAL